MMWYMSSYLQYVYSRMHNNVLSLALLLYAESQRIRQCDSTNTPRSTKAALNSVMVDSTLESAFSYHI